MRPSCSAPPRCRTPDRASGVGDEQGDDRQSRAPIAPVVASTVLTPQSLLRRLPSQRADCLPLGARGGGIGAALARLPVRTRHPVSRRPGQAMVCSSALKGDRESASVRVIAAPLQGRSGSAASRQPRAGRVYAPNVNGRQARIENLRRRGRAAGVSVRSRRLGRSVRRPTAAAGSPLLLTGGGLSRSVAPSARPFDTAPLAPRRYAIDCARSFRL
jgi:hypothetical protein